MPATGEWPKMPTVKDFSTYQRPGGNKTPTQPPKTPTDPHQLGPYTYQPTQQVTGEKVKVKPTPVAFRQPFWSFFCHFGRH